MKTLIDLENWSRREHFSFFSKSEEPFFGVTVEVDCTKAYASAKEKGQSFFLYYLYRALNAANQIQNFRYRIVDNEVYLFDQVHASPTIPRPDNTFGFAYINYHTNEELFYDNALEEIQRVKQSTTLHPTVSVGSVIHFSALPWLSFTWISHARSFSFNDSSPKISFGKLNTKEGLKTMPVAVHVHHGLADGYHVGLFVANFQDLLNE
ncbi:chloramphenicol acetyltransferase [Desertivirga brevis]|uniref:chloramphenicol acetyltransferase n=1 Tax=Desertivirga brevis TaxID=2810310 RepID=UPI001A97263F|nr:chloramphenicol acetyltransferase [Pedobacter sp. SYSU D00873]